MENITKSITIETSPVKELEELIGLYTEDIKRLTECVKRYVGLSKAKQEKHKDAYNRFIGYRKERVEELKEIMGEYEIQKKAEQEFAETEEFLQGYRAKYLPPVENLIDIHE